jgi:aldehyde dehydrogenase (NAD+)
MIMKSFNPDAVALPSGHWINGKYLEAEGVIDVRRPSDGVQYFASPIADENIVDQAVQAAEKAVRRTDWAKCRPRERRNVLMRWADLLEAQAERLAQLEALSSTRPISQASSSDVVVTIEQIRFFAEFADKEGGQVVPTDSDHLGMILRESFGVVSAITPWNVPLSMAGWKIAPALAAGNAIVIKPSEITPFSTLFIAELAKTAGIPDGILNVVLGDGPTTGSHLVAHPLVGKVSFTGSTVSGGAILRNLSHTGIKPVTLELGGKSPQIVFPSANIERAASHITRGILNNAGQACVAGSRLIVHESVAGELLERLQLSFSIYKAGPTWVAESDYSPIISQKQLERIDGIVQSAIAEGADCITGGRQLSVPGFFYEPTILAALPRGSRPLSEEIFGPVLIVEQFREEDEGFALANDSAYGLAAGVYTGELGQAMRAIKQLEAGTVWVNRYGRSLDHILPTGGYKRSGIGKDLGREAYDAQFRQKTVLLEF